MIFDAYGVRRDCLLNIFSWATFSFFGWVHLHICIKIAEYLVDFAIWLLLSKMRYEKRKMSGRQRMRKREREKFKFTEHWTPPHTSFNNNNNDNNNNQYRYVWSHVNLTQIKFCYPSIRFWLHIVCVPTTPFTIHHTQ